MLIVPISIARFANYTGASVPYGFTFLADLIFALGGWFFTDVYTPTPRLMPPFTVGFANLLLFLSTRRLIPDPNTIPDLSTPRSRLDKESPQAVGITPFKLTLKDAEAKPGRTTATASDVSVFVSLSETETRTESEALGPRESVGSFLSVASHESMLPLNPR